MAEERPLLALDPKANKSELGLKPSFQLTTYSFIKAYTRSAKYRPVPATPALLPETS
jgi:hypothetical protein